MCDLVERLKKLGADFRLCLRDEAANTVETAAAELTRLRSENAELDAECKASMATIAAERERADKAEALAADLVDAWDSLPEGNYDTATVAKWLLLKMQPVINKMRALLSRVSGSGGGNGE